MAQVTVRDLRNHGGDVLDRVLAGEDITITRSGVPVADLVRHRQPGVTVECSSTVGATSRTSIRRGCGPIWTRPWTRRCDASCRGDLDASTLINLPRLVSTEALPHEALITTITLAELSVGPLVARDEIERANRQAILQQAEADFVPLPFDVAAVRAFGRVAAALRRSGRKTPARAYDAMIAAIALAIDLPVHTCNPADFAGIDGLDVVSVPTPRG